LNLALPSLPLTFLPFYLSLTCVKVRLQSKVCLLDIDIQGVQNVRKSKLDCKAIFITPPSLTELEKRLRGRGTDTGEKLKIRLENAVNEIAFSQVRGNFDAVLCNDNIDETFENLCKTLQGWFPELDLYVRK
jgi:guanylate kinase